MILTKWYCDCVTADGDVFLGYWARLSWWCIAIPFASSLVKPAHRQPSEYRVICAGRPPVIHGETLDWTCSKLGVQGRWKRSQRPYRQLLMDDPCGSITWRCHVPTASADVQLPDGASLHGLGYAEELTLSTPLSRLPFDELLWGRFVSESDALTWIVWLGSMPRQWVVHNGIAVSGVTVDEEGVRLAGDDGRLELHERVRLRDGPLASTALRGIPGARRWLLRNVDVHETKWLSAGTLTTRAHTSSGWVIHESVRLRPG